MDIQFPNAIQVGGRAYGVGENEKQEGAILV